MCKCSDLCLGFLSREDQKKWVRSLSSTLALCFTCIALPVPCAHSWGVSFLPGGYLLLAFSGYSWPLLRLPWRVLVWIVWFPSSFRGVCFTWRLKPLVTLSGQVISLGTERLLSSCLSSFVFTDDSLTWEMSKFYSLSVSASCLQWKPLLTTSGSWPSFGHLGFRENRVFWVGQRRLSTVRGCGKCYSNERMTSAL